MIKNRSATPIDWLKTIKWLYVGAALLWFGAAGWREFGHFTLPRHLRSDQLESRAATCTGATFLETYDCKLDIRIVAGRRTFNILVGKFLILFLPPILMAFSYSYISRRMWRDAEDVRKRHHRERLARSANSPPPPPPAAP